MIRGRGATKEIVAQSLAEVGLILATFAGLPDPFKRPSEDAWSPAEVIEHLRLAVRPLSLAFALPRFVLKVFGQPGPPRSYDQIVETYRRRLAAGAGASAPFVPARLQTGADREALARIFQDAYATYAARLRELGDGLDTAALPHPILGRLSLREMSFFTLYHLRHHHAALAQRSDRDPAGSR